MNEKSEMKHPKMFSYCWFEKRRRRRICVIQIENRKLKVFKNI